MPPTNDFSLIITAHRGGPMLQACLESAARLDPPPRELILAIDGADPAVLDAAKSPVCKVLTRPQGRGARLRHAFGLPGKTKRTAFLSQRREGPRFAQAFSGSTKWSRRGDSNP